MYICKAIRMARQINPDNVYIQELIKKGLPGCIIYEYETPTDILAWLKVELNKFHRGSDANLVDIYMQACVADETTRRDDTRRRRDEPAGSIGGGCIHHLPQAGEDHGGQLSQGCQTETTRRQEHDKDKTDRQPEQTDKLQACSRTGRRNGPADRTGPDSTGGNTDDGRQR